MDPEEAPAAAAEFNGEAAGTLDEVGQVLFIPMSPVAPVPPLPLLPNPAMVQKELTASVAL